MKLPKQVKDDLQSYLKDKLRNREVRTHIIAPYELSEAEIDEIRSRVDMIGHSKVEVIVDKTILAGVIIKQGSKLIDYSLKSKVESLFNSNES